MNVSHILCARYGTPKIAELLIQEGENVNHSDRDGWTPLVHCALNGRTEIAKFLIGKGTGLSQTNKNRTMKSMDRLVRPE
jgi:ankyrin repeat protein